MKFPKLIHVTQETPDRDDPFLVVNMGGVFDLDRVQPVAIYKLVKVGRVLITKQFEENRKRK